MFSELRRLKTYLR